MLDGEKERALFEECLEQAPETREAFIRKACGEGEMADRLRALIRAHEAAEAATREAGLEEQGRFPDRIGPYRLLQVLGEGGMGVVYEAEQTEPIRRRVALKLIRLGLNTRQVVSRFEAERQALAVMDHPNIARVLDAGATEQGLPYFVMELVKGIPLLEYCDRRRLSTRARIELFMVLCQAVQHAHQKGVIHRDLKPSNVLVEEENGRPRPKIIDFGIAKAVGSPLTDTTLVTLHGQTLGTPAYMSPEQAMVSGLDVDTRSDVYSLGVMLYELLVGTLPVDVKRMGIHAYIAKLAERETNPPTPSVRLASLGAHLKVVARNRTSDPGTLRNELRGDLDWIVMKALEADRNRRYSTAAALAEDLERHLNDEPVQCRPPSSLYRFAKFVRRNRFSVAAAGVAIVAIILGGLAAAVGLLEARRAEVRAVREAETARQVSDFLVGLFEVSDPSESRGNTITARDILDRGALRIREELQEQPLVQARLLHTIGGVYWALGLEEEAFELVEEAGRLREELQGGESLELAESLRLLAEILSSHFGGIPLERRERMLELLERARDIHISQLGADHPEVGQDWIHIAHALADRIPASDPRRYREASEAYLEAIRIWEDAYGPDDPRLAEPLRQLGNHTRRRLGDPGAAGPYFHRALSILEKAHGPTSPLVLPALYESYRLEMRNWNRDSAPVEELYQRLWAIPEEEVLKAGVEIGVYINLGNTRLVVGRLDQSEDCYRRALTLARKMYGPDHEIVPVALSSLSNLYFIQQRWPEIRDVLAEARPLWERNQRTVEAINCQYGTALALLAEGRETEAEPLLEEAVESYRVHSPRRNYPAALEELILLRQKQGRSAEAGRLRERLLELYRRNAGDELAQSFAFRFYALALLGCREDWRFGTDPVECPRAPLDPLLALEQARKAVELDRNSQNLRALGLSLYFAGEVDAAVAALDESIDELFRGDPSTPEYQQWRDRFASAN